MKCVIFIKGEKYGRDSIELPEAPMIGDEVGYLNGDKSYTMKVSKRRWIGSSGIDSYLVLEGVIPVLTTNQDANNP